MDIIVHFQFAYLSYLETVILRYEPFKCSFCDVSTETREQILAHCAETHEITSQFKCGFCMFGANTKTEVSLHTYIFCSTATLLLGYVRPHI